MVPRTSNYWPYHTELLVFCLKFRLSPVCEYLNYYYKISNGYWAIPEKIQTGEFEEIFRFLEIPRLKIFLINPKNPTSFSVDYWNFHIDIDI